MVNFKCSKSPLSSFRECERGFFYEHHVSVNLTVNASLLLANMVSRARVEVLPRAKVNTGDGSPLYFDGSNS